MVVTAGNASHSDGGEGSSRGGGPLAVFPREPSHGEKFPRAIAKIAVAQICESAGFQSIQRSALETLADIAIRYLCDVGKNAQLYANLAGRTESNAFDAVAALEDMSGASFSDPDSLATSSVCVKELFKFLEYGDELPFAKPLPHFPLYRTNKPKPSFAQLDETPPEPHIPPWLPAFPDPETYVATPVQNEDKQDAHMDNFEQTRQRQKAEQSLVALRFRLCTSGASTSKDNSPPHIAKDTAPMGTSPPSASRSTPSEQQEPGKLDSEGLHNKAKSGKRPSSSAQNPFLAPPLPAGAKPVSTLIFDNMKPPSPAPSTKKIIAPAFLSMLDAFRPASGAASNNGQESSGTLRPGGLPALKDRRSGLISLEFRRKEVKRDRLEMEEDEEEEKKKRAQQIFSQYFHVDDDDDDAT